MRARVPEFVRGGSKMKSSFCTQHKRGNRDLAKNPSFQQKKTEKNSNKTKTWATESRELERKRNRKKHWNDDVCFVLFCLEIIRDFWNRWSNFSQHIHTNTHIQTCTRAHIHTQSALAQSTKRKRRIFNDKTKRVTCSI